MGTSVQDAEKLWNALEQRLKTYANTARLPDARLVLKYRFGICQS